MIAARCLAILCAGALLAGCAGRSAAPATQPDAKRAAPASAAERQKRVDRAIERGVAFLVKSQNPDGSWGTGLETRGLEIYSMVPGSHDAFRVATTALCVMALREAGETTAHARGVEYLVTRGEARRDDPSILYNIWAHIFTVHALALEMKHNPDPRLAKAAAWHIDRLVRYECATGGWNYYDFEVGTQKPSSGSTSFSNAAGLVALWQARQAGLEVPQPLIDRALRRLREMRLPNGSYLYGEYLQYAPQALANRTRGSIGRNQPCNYALWLWDFGGVGKDKCIKGLEEFLVEHDYLEIGRKRPYPHDSWYQVAPYYYYFDHYYAARLVERLGPEASRYADAICDWIVPLQEEDGSWWDYAMWDYHKPYGTAFAVMTLRRCRPGAAAPARSAGE